VQSEREYKKIDAHTALAKQGWCNHNSEQTVNRVDSGVIENNGNMLQASRQSSIPNNKATSTYYLLW
jgi:hypothetical protein